MTANKIDVDLNGVPKTLLLPLFGRAKFSQVGGPIYDEHAVRIVKLLNYDFDSLAKKVGNTPLFWMARAFHFDEAIKKYLLTHPKATIVNLGAGLETAFYRVDNGELTWIDLDLPEVIALREKLLPQEERINYLSKSIFDFSWMEEVKQHGKDIFFFAGGLFMYFEESEVKSLLNKIASQFPQSELIFDTISQKGLIYANAMLTQANMSQARLKWGIDDSKDLEKWSPNIKLISQFPYFKKIKTKFQFPFSMRLKMFFLDFVDKGGITHLKFL